MQIDAQQANQGIDTVPAMNAARTTWSTQVSIADGLYLLILVAAAILRFTELGATPLSPAEAEEALAIWRFLQPGSMAVTISSPAYFTLTSLIAPIIGVNDTVMRFVPATFGLAMLFLPWFLRKQLGIIGSLVSAALLAVSPLNSIVSRTVGGDTIALFALMLIAVSIIHLRNNGNDKWYYSLAIASGLGAASSTLFYGGLATLTLAWWATGFTVGERERLVRPAKTTQFNALILGFLVLIGLSTRILTYPAGLGASAQLLGDWLGQFDLRGDLPNTIASILSLIRYEIVLIILGPIAVIWAIWRGRLLGNLLTFWLIAALGLMLLQNGVLTNALLATLPGYLLVGLLSAYLLRWGMSRWTWAVTGGILLVAAVVLVNFTRYLRISTYEQDISNLWFGILALGTGALMLYYFWSMTNVSIVQGFWLATLLLLLAFEWGTAWQLTHVSANDPRERWVTSATDNDLPLLLKTLQDISRSETNSDTDLTILSSVDTPTLRWYLRDFWQATIGQTIPPQAQHQAIISLVGQEEPQLGNDYIGSDFGLARNGSAPAPVSETPLNDILRWWLFHETPMGIIEDRVILWVRTDLVLPQ